jgi:hypothetical protein
MDFWEMTSLVLTVITYIYIQRWLGERNFYFAKQKSDSQLFGGKIQICFVFKACTQVVLPSGQFVIPKKIFCFVFCFLSDITHYWVFGCPSAYWYISIWRLCQSPIQNLECRISWQTLQPITLCCFCVPPKVFPSLRHDRGSNLRQGDLSSL